MTLLSIVRRDPALLKELETEENNYFQNIRRRADIFMEEAQACNLDFVPYKAGFFISVPTLKSAQACAKLQEDLIFAAPLARGIRLGVCSIPAYKMTGVASKIKKALESVDG